MYTDCCCRYRKVVTVVVSAYFSLWLVISNLVQNFYIVTALYIQRYEYRVLQKTQMNLVCTFLCFGRLGRFGQYWKYANFEVFFSWAEYKRLFLDKLGFMALGISLIQNNVLQNLILLYSKLLEIKAFGLGSRIRDVCS